MNDEIKVILNYLDIYKNLNEGLLNSKDKKLLLDYITNLQTIERQYSAILSENAELQQENERLKERIAYLERSNDRREDTIIGLRFEVAEQEDYKSRCEKASDKLSFIDEALENDTLNVPLCITKINSALNILQNGSEE